MFLFILLLCSSKYVQLWKRDARKISAAKTITKSINEDLVYYYIKYCCSQGGRKFSSRGTAERNTATLKKGYPFTLRYNPHF